MSTPIEVANKLSDLAQYYSNIEFVNLAAVLREAEQTIRNLINP